MNFTPETQPQRGSSASARVAQNFRYWYPVYRTSANKPSGWVNPGWLCYRNSIITLLLHTPIFINWIEHLVGDGAAYSGVVCDCAGDSCVIAAFRDLAAEYWFGKISEHGVQSRSRGKLQTTLNSLTDELWSKLLPGWGKPEGQQDVFEFFDFFPISRLRDHFAYSMERRDELDHIFSTITVRCKRCGCKPGLQSTENN